jgi:hypothetical protein
MELLPIFIAGVLTIKTEKAHICVKLVVLE